jgi:hypothetical protein
VKEKFIKYNNNNSNNNKKLGCHYKVLITNKDENNTPQAMKENTTMGTHSGPQ